jgi:hypothetical protein
MTYGQMLMLIMVVEELYFFLTAWWKNGEERKTFILTLGDSSGHSDGSVRIDGMQRHTKHHH